MVVIRGRAPRGRTHRGRTRHTFARTSKNAVRDVGVPPERPSTPPRGRQTDATGGTLSLSSQPPVARPEEPRRYRPYPILSDTVAGRGSTAGTGGRRVPRLGYVDDRFRPVRERRLRNGTWRDGPLDRPPLPIPFSFTGRTPRSWTVSTSDRLGTRRPACGISPLRAADPGSRMVGPECSDTVGQPTALAR